LILEEKMQQSIDIVIPTYNQSAFTLKCFQSIKQFTNIKYRIIWIDNNSSENEYNTVRNWLIDNEINFFNIRNTENLGFIKATNQGIATSTSPYICLMNNDTKAVPGWDDKMLVIFDMEPNAGMVGSLCSIANNWQNINRFRRTYPMVITPYFEVPASRSLAFFCTLIKREVIKEIGYLSEDFGIGFGDDDWYSELVRKAGFKLFLALDIVIPHYHRTTFSSCFDKEEIKKMQDQALEKFNKKCGEDKSMKETDKLKVFFALGDKGGSGFVRVITPAIYLENKCNVKIWIDEKDNPYINESDILVMQRQSNPKIISFIDILKTTGKKVVYELDDNLWQIPHNNSHKVFWKPETIKNVERIISLCDGVTVSTEPLADIVRKFSKNVVVLPNSMEFAPWMDEPKKENNKVRIGWAGGYQHKCDLDICSHVLKEIAEKYKDKVQIVFMGMMPDDFLGIAEHYPFVEYSLYIDSLRKLNFDIGILPLEDNMFNKSKSAIKFVDYSALHIASIASPVYPYATTIENGITGLLVKKNRYKEWIKSIELLINDVDLRNKIADNSNKFVKEKFDISKNVKLWDEFYRGLM
jgi:GT2 family glycosyltransferase